MCVEWRGAGGREEREGRRDGGREGGRWDAVVAVRPHLPKQRSVILGMYSRACSENQSPSG